MAIGHLASGVDNRAQMQAALGDAFTIEGELEGAARAGVYIAEECALRRRVVIKTLPRSQASSDNLERFRREIAIAARLQHPHLVPLLTAGQIASSGVLWFSMPYVEGESLRDVLQRRETLPLDMAVRLMREIALALAYAHRRGVVHRDIKPDNVLLSDGVAMITDFGVAKAIEAAAAAPKALERQITTAGATLGTPAYISPEQIAAASEVDHRADLYSFGCMAYEMLSGSVPFGDRNHRDMLIAQVQERPAPLDTVRSGLPPELARVVMKCLRKDPARRPQSASEIVNVVDGLSRYLLNDVDRTSASAVAPPPLSSPEPAPRPSLVTQRSSPLFTGLLVVALTVVLAMAVAVFR